MKEMFRYGSILALICMLAGGLLAGVNYLTRGRILAQVQAEEESGLKDVLPQAGRFETVKAADELLYYKAFDKEGKWFAVVFKASGKGYSSDIETLAGMTLDAKILAIKVLAQNETPGLGSRVLEPEFAAQFTGKDMVSLEDVQAIAGATVSSSALIESVKQKALQIKGLIDNAAAN